MLIFAGIVSSILAYILGYQAKKRNSEKLRKLAYACIFVGAGTFWGASSGRVSDDAIMGINAGLWLTLMTMWGASSAHPETAKPNTDKVSLTKRSTPTNAEKIAKKIKNFFKNFFADKED